MMRGRSPVAQGRPSVDWIGARCRRRLDRPQGRPGTCAAIDRTLSSSGSTPGAGQVPLSAGMSSGPIRGQRRSPIGLVGHSISLGAHGPPSGSHVNGSDSRQRTRQPDEGRRAEAAPILPSAGRGVKPFGHSWHAPTWNDASRTSALTPGSGTGTQHPGTPARVFHVEHPTGSQPTTGRDVPRADWLPVPLRTAAAWPERRSGGEIRSGHGRDRARAPANRHAIGRPSGRRAPRPPARRSGQRPPLVPPDPVACSGARSRPGDRPCAGTAAHSAVTAGGPKDLATTASKRPRSSRMPAERPPPGPTPRRHGASHPSSVDGPFQEPHRRSSASSRTSSRSGRPHGQHQPGQAAAAAQVQERSATRRQARAKPTA